MDHRQHGAEGIAAARPGNRVRGAEAVLSARGRRRGDHRQGVTRAKVFWNESLAGDPAGLFSLAIESEAKRRLADEYDAAQERGEVAKRADGPAMRDHVPNKN